MCDVAIVGGGPVGLTLANLLWRRGVDVIVLERQAKPYDLPRAIHFDGEAMRVFQAAGLADAILPHTHVGKGMLFKDPDGKLLVDWSRDQAIGPMGWHESYRFYQPGIEHAMRDRLAELPNVRHFTGADVVNIDVATRHLALGDGREVQARFIVGCDGAQSGVRTAIGSDFLDLGFQERWLVVDLKLLRPREDLGDHSVQFCDPEAPCTYVRGAGPWRRWEMRLTDSDADNIPEAEIWQRLRQWITPEDASLERGAVYTFRSRIARTWSHGAVFIAGDAAHQMPPFMGQGLCAGLRDVANLWWKLLVVLRGADPKILATYQSEREVNALAFIERSVALGRLINQTTAGQSPAGKMASIWPDLGPGLGIRDGIGGRLAPQAVIQGKRADDQMGYKFYLLSPKPYDSPLPNVIGEKPWFHDLGCDAAILRPDGYCLGKPTAENIELAIALNRCLASEITVR